MTPADWTLVKEHFADLVDRPVHERTTGLEAVPPALRAEVASLLRAADSEGGLLDEPLAAAPGLRDLANDALRDGTKPQSLPDRLGPYRLLDVLGEGGMGEVLLAERADGLFERKVALKRVRGWRPSEATVRRFEAERRILAGLRHPGIARLLDAGSDEHGRPYFAMDYVEGEPITDYAHARRLDLDARLDLFRDVCAAVHHAHQALVVHRDLKPSNVLVTERTDGTPRPVLLDFGIARLMDGEGDGLTVTGVRPMTRAYAAPEQIRGEPVTTATDVYALGVLLYELLTGRRPFEAAIDAGLETAILERPPDRPSAHPDDTLGVPAERLRGDLDTVCLKAMAKEPERRYASAAALAEDLERVQRSLPIAARAPSAAYRARRFVRRHRLGVGVAAAVLLGGLTLGAFYTTRLAQERDAARQQAARAEAVSGFLADLFRDADPTVSQGDTLTALQMLERGARRLSAELADQPGVRADLNGVISQAYLGLGAGDSAVAFARRALAVREPGGAAPSPIGALEARMILADALFLSEPVQAAALMDEAVREARALGDEHVLLDALSLQLQLSAESSFTPQELTAGFEEAIALSRRLDGEGSRRLGVLLYDFALVVSSSGDHGRGEELLRAALESQPAETLPYPRSITLRDLANVLMFSGRLPEARRAAEEALELRMRLYGRSHTRTARAMSTLGDVMLRQGEAAEAEAMAREAHRTLLDGGDRAASLEPMRTLESALTAQGRYAEALEVARAMLQANVELYGTEGPKHAADMRSYAFSLTRAGLYQEAAEAWDEAIRLQGIAFGPESAVTVSSLIDAARAAEGAGQADRAGRLLADAYARSRSIDETSRTRAYAALRYGRHLLDQGRPADALPVLEAAAAARAALERPSLNRRPGSTSDPDRATALLGEALVRTGATERGAQLLAGVTTALADSLGADHPDARRARQALDRAQ